MYYEDLIEEANSPNIKSMSLDHSKNFFNSYEKISHVPYNNKTGFYLFHNEVLKKINKILELYNLSGKLFGIYADKNSLEESRIVTILIDKNNHTKNDYDVSMMKLMDDYGTSKLKSILGNINEDKVRVDSVNYCYTIRHQIYSIDIQYTKKK